MTDDAITGAILGCAVGDALGLPYEALSRRRGVRLLGPTERHRFIFGRGMVSDDTEHTCLVAQALCAAPADSEVFGRELARRLRWWLLGLPAGIGSATLRAVLKLWLGFGPAHSGVFSAGNGPAMRSAVLGAALAELGTLRDYVRASTRLTHTDPKAEYGAFAVAIAAWLAKRGEQQQFFDQLRSTLTDDGANEFLALMARVQDSLAANETTEQFAAKLGLEHGVSGYVYHTVPVVIHGWLRHPNDFRAGVTAMIRCGGDTDTTAAILGGIIGSGCGRAGIPPDWLAGVWEWPRTTNWMQRLAQATREAVSGQRPVKSPAVVPLVGCVRNAVFLLAVLAHVVRRLLPPY